MTLNDPTPEGSFALPSGELVAWDYACSGTQPCLVDVNTGASLCASGVVTPDFKLCVNQFSNGTGVVFSEIGSNTAVRRIEDISEIATFSPDWHFLIGYSASSPDDLNIWKVSDGQMIGRLALRSPPLNSVSWSPDGRRLAVIDQYANVQLWNAVTGQFMQKLPNPASPDTPLTGPIRAAFSPDGSRLAVLGRGQSLVLWNMASGHPVVQPKIAGSGMAWSPDGAEIAVINDQQQVVVVNAATGNIQRSTKANAEAECFGCVNGISWSPDSKQIAIGSYGEVILYDAATLNQVSTLTYRSGGKPDIAIPYVAYSPDGRSLAAVIPQPDQYILAILDLPSKQVRTSRLASNSPNRLLPLSSLTWSPNGRFLAVGYGTALIELGGFFTTGGDIAIFNARTSQQVARLHGHADDTEGISFSPDGKRLASASLDGTALIWDLTGL